MSEVDQLGNAYRRALRVSSVIATLPAGLAYPLNRLWLRWSNPDSARQTAWEAALAARNLIGLWPQRRKLLADFFLNAFKHRRFNEQWVAQRLRYDTASIETLKQQGGALLLTYHTPFHHTMFVALGLLGLKLRVLAAPEQASPIWHYIGDYLHTLHRNCARHFNGGDYAFFSSGRSAIRAADNALKAGEIVVSLHDFPPGSAMSVNGSLLGQPFSIPVGVIEFARRQATPIYLCTFVPRGKQFELTLTPLPSGLALEQIVSRYLDALTIMCQDNPALWDNWPLWHSAQAHQEIETS